MCFTKHPKHPTVKIAKRSIVCYKRFQHTWKFGELASPYRGYIYKVGETKSINPVRFSKKPYIEKHYFRASNVNIHIGLHSYSSLSIAIMRRSSSESIYRCIIPKGSMYWYNPFKHEYVSTSLTVKNKL